ALASSQPPSPSPSDLPANPACLLLPVVWLFLVACEFRPLPPPPAASPYPTIRSAGFIFSSHSSKKRPLNKAMFYSKIARLSIGSYHC
ncbi:hypothetical protein BDZ91DRAFT_721993, partial [Kalaharituber pfeilii]